MSNPILSDIIGQYGEFFKATDKFFNIVAAYSRRINEETKKIKTEGTINKLFDRENFLKNSDKEKAWELIK